MGSDASNWLLREVMGDNVPATVSNVQFHHHLHHFNLSVDITGEYMTTVFHAVVHQLAS